MELNEIHSEHEHATTSLKVLLLVFAIVLVGALAYLVWASNTAPDTTDNSTVVTKKTTADETADWKTFKAGSEISAGITFKYPPTYTVEEGSEGNIVIKDGEAKIVADLTAFSADYADVFSNVSNGTSDASGWFQKTPTQSAVQASLGTACTKLSGTFGATTYFGNTTISAARTEMTGFTLFCADSGTFIANFYDNGDRSLQKNFEDLIKTLHS
ncbi:MAG: hypothetical protein NUV80_05090 [Candidatus Berkelbacteria bacterium]|nr:hypothetical protein [Candidatus Berkelbacteria bacterium]MCR4307913.1 hypothetical protein [Candidatus Berkelbacteria bacterium]